jgi:SAM-dependent methyltransferase
MSILASVIKGFLETLSGRSASRRELERYRTLHEFIQRRITEDVYPEYPDAIHTRVTHEAIERIDARWPLRGKRVLDVGCGQGLALEKFAAYGAIATGLTFGEDFEACRRKGFDVREMDMSFLDFPAASFDLLWARHSLEHSLFPYFTLDGFVTALRPGGLLYVEVPAPDTSANHQHNKNHYACLTRSTWVSLFGRVGLETLEAKDLDVQLVCGPDVWHTFLLRRP